VADEVTVVAVFKVKPEAEERALGLLRDVAEATHGEEGCVKYTLHKAGNEPGAYCLVEKWRSQADLDAHFRQPHMTQLAGAGDLLTEPPQVFFCEQIDAGDATKGAI
jgi:quinol monooxygenase YgiN